MFTNSYPSSLSLPNSNTPFPHPYSPPFPSRTFLAPFLVPQFSSHSPILSSFLFHPLHNPTFLPKAFNPPPSLLSSLFPSSSYPSSLLKYSPSSLPSLSFNAPLPSSLIKAPIPPPP
ncbi:uncharacterized protein [Euwallacea similis]|uniref:uncharacterized protein n=1 Tax=Euwallacea similis TaxID=1736056 RepID=UPI00344DA0EC